MLILANFHYFDNYFVKAKSFQKSHTQNIHSIFVIGPQKKSWPVGVSVQLSESSEELVVYE